MRLTSTSGILRAVILAMCAATAASAQMGGGMGHHGNGNGNGNSNMGRGMGGVMLTSGGTPYRSDRTIVRIDDAQAIAERYLNSLAASGLALDEIEEWDYNFYVVVKETAAPEYKAFQLLIDKWTGAVMPEPGPNMMWNQKYRMRGGMGHLGQPGQGTQPMPITVGEANAAAMQFLRERTRSMGTTTSTSRTARPA